VGLARRLAAERVVTAPDGRVWTVRRRWKLRLRWRSFDLPDIGPDGALGLADFAGFESPIAFLTAIAVGIVVVAALAVLVVLVLPLVLLVLEAVVLAVWVVLLGRSWIVEAATVGPPSEALRLEACGWRDSRRAVDDAADALERGERPV
jgi:hypothetical protein